MSKVSAGKKEKHLALKKKIPIKETSWFYFLPYAMVAKETSEVITKTTKPKVIIQTKKLSEETNLSEQSWLWGVRKGKWIWKLLIVVLLLLNAIIGFLTYLTTKEQFRFTIMSSGGLENYQMLQNLYASPAFQQASTLSIYQLIERIDQTLASVQEDSTAQP